MSIKRLNYSIIYNTKVSSFRANGVTQLLKNVTLFTLWIGGVTGCNTVFNLSFGRFVKTSKELIQDQLYYSIISNYTQKKFSNRLFWVYRFCKVLMTEEYLTEFKEPVSVLRPK